MKKILLQIFNEFTAEGVDPAAAATLAVAAAEQKATLNQDELADYLGVSRDKSDRLLADGSIPHFTIGRRRFVLKERVLEWCERMSRTASSALKTPTRPVYA